MFSGIVHPGVPHQCNKTARNNNIVASLTRDLSPDGTRRVAAKLVNTLRTDEAGRKGDSLDLPSGSRTLHISFRKPIERRQISTEALLKLKTLRNLSNNLVQEIAQVARIELGRGGVQTGLKKELTNLKNRLRDFLQVNVVLMNNKKAGETILERDLLSLNDLPSLILSVCEARNLDPLDCVLTLGLDDGQQSLKVNIFILSFICISRNNYA